MARRGEVVIRFKLGGTADVATKINDIADALGKIVKIEPQIGALAKQVDKLATSLTALGKTGNTVKKLAKALNEVDAKKVDDARKKISGLAAVSGIVSTVAGSVSKGFGSIGNTVMSVGLSVSRFSRNVSEAFLRVSRGVIMSMRGMTLGLTQFGSAIRMVGQGFQNLGTMASIFISYPVGRALKGMTETAIDFDDALVKIQKTTNMTDEALGRMSDTVDLLSMKADELSGRSLPAISDSLETMSGRLLDMARYTSTPLEDLAALAEEAGRLGIESPDLIMEFVKASEMIGVATDVAAEDAIKAFSKLAQATGLLRDESGNLLDEAGQNMMRLANMVNELENTTMSSASEIVSAMERMTAAGAEFDIPAQSLAAFAATLIESGMNAERAGTAFDRVITYMTKNLDRLASATGVASEDIAKAMDEDVVGALTNVIGSLGEVESSTEAAQIAFEIFGVYGKRAVALLGGSYERLLNNMETAHNEFAHGTSLVDEYYKALDSTRSQMDIFSNNVKVASVLLGRAFLPTLNRILQIGVAAIQLLTEQWEKLNDQTKVFALLGVALAIVLPPIFMAVGSLVFVFGMFISAMGTLGTAIVSIVGLLANSFLPAVGLITMGFLAAPGIVMDVFDSIENIISNATDAALGWGEGIIRSLALGILRGAAFVVRAVYKIAETIAGFFRSHSPPDMGPLSSIDKWGASLMDNLLLGFKLADFGILSDVGKYIKGFFDALDIGGDNISRSILEARDKVKELIDVFNDTGDISKTILSDIGKMFGDVGFAVKDLLTLQLEYNKEVQVLTELEKTLEDLKRRKEEINDTYDDEIAAIAATDLSAEERSKLMREARAERNLQVSIVEDEVDATEDAAEIQGDIVDAIKDQVTWQQTLLDQLLEEAKLFQDIREEAEKTAGSLAGAGGVGDLGDLGGGLDDIDFSGGFDWGGLIDPDGANASLEEIDLGIEKMRGKFDEARLAVLTFWAAITGGEVPEEAINEYEAPVYGGSGDSQPEFKSTLIQNAYEWGVKLRDIWVEISEGVMTVVDNIQELSGQYGELVGEIQSASLEGLPEPVQKFAEELQKLDPAQMLLILTIGPKVLGILFKLLSIVSLLIVPFGVLFKVAGWLFGVFSTLAANQTFLWILVTIGEILAGVSLAMWGLIGAVIALIAAIIIFGPAAWENLKGIVENIGIILGEMWERVKKFFGKLIEEWKRRWGVLKEKVKEIWEGIKEAVAGAIQKLADKMGLDLESMKKRWGKIWEDVKKIGKELWRRIVGAVLSVVGSMLARLYNEWMKIKASAKAVWLLIKLTLAMAALKTIDAIVTTFGPLVERLGEIWESVKSSLTTAWEEVKDAVVGVVSAAYDELVAGLTVWWDIGTFLIEGIRDGVLAKAGELIDAATTAVQNALDAVKEKLGISSPSDEGVSIGESLVQGVIDGIGNKINDALTAASTFVGDMVDMIIEKMISWKDDVLPTALADILTVFETTFALIGTTIEETIKNAFNSAISFVEKALNNIISGINHIASTIPGLSALMPGLPLTSITLPRLAEGGIVGSPMAAIIGDIAGGEAVVPLRKLPALMAEAAAVNTGNQINIRIDRVDASDKNDVDSMIDEIARRLGQRATIGARLGAGARM